MFGWTFLYAFLTFIAFITGLFSVFYLVMGSIKKDRNLIVFGLKVLLVAVLAIVIKYGVLLQLIKGLFAKPLM